MVEVNHPENLKKPTFFTPVRVSIERKQGDLPVHRSTFIRFHISLKHKASANMSSSSLPIQSLT